ncbi:WS/DGAT domain-containing protein [Nocardia transvalensis]|uniref:WS/DGAT domain-containing protein n=1 Tax=Nocardia transvalensis TaxID=37333 RepID=UPI0018960DDF|nr:WS/DGAT domain-containing protein [Nocardia transvalensis]MBF6328480.1 DUF1298 domain-containing protein [Nocardia transvalensis]
MPALTPQDATRYWLSRRSGNDLFLLYCFEESERSTERLRALVAARSARIPDLRVRVRERRFAYPDWVPCEFAEDQVVEHAVSNPVWPNIVAALGDLLGDSLAAEDRAWRLHLFRHVTGAPAGEGDALVAVLQLSHALADGRHAAAIARSLFTDSDPGDRVAGTRAGVRTALEDTAAEAIALARFPLKLGHTVVRGLAAERARRALAESTSRGEVPAPAPEVAATLLNLGPPPRAHAVRMLVRDDLRVPGYTITVVALTAIGAALSRYLESRAAPSADLAAQVSMARPNPDGHARNNYRDLAVELHTAEPDHRRRADHIAATLAARRTRAHHPLLSAQDRVTATLPAPLLRRDVATYPLDRPPTTLTGHTVVSSVNRGPADLTFADGPVRFTAGFPALGTVMHLTHGIHGLGHTITVSVHADPAVVPDPDHYAALLDASLTEVVERLRE